MVATITPGELVDRVRRDAERNVLRVRNGLKHLAGVGRPQLTQTPKETVWAAEKVELWHYPSDRVRYRTPLVFVHSLVSRSYVFDLVPGNSFVETMLDSGFDVYLVDWGVPDELESGNTLETYTDGYIPTVIREVQRQTGNPDVNLFGYCFGGVLSLLSLAGNPDLPVRSLAVMATPVDMAHTGPMSSMMAEGRVEPEDLLDATGNVPADVMLNSFKVLAPTGDVVNYVNLLQNMWNDEYVAAHQAMTQWAQDHIPFPARRSARWVTCCRARTCWRRARCRSAGAPSTSPTSPSRSSASSARRTTSCRRTPSAHWPASSARPTSRSCACRPGTSA